MQNGMIDWTKIYAEHDYGNCIIDFGDEPFFEINNQKLKYNYCNIISKDKKFIVHEITSMHALPQFIGYAKYKLHSDGQVLFRGQTSYYKEMRPSLFRKGKKVVSAQKNIAALKKYIEYAINCDAFQDAANPGAYEALLQQYGINTPWIDLVDNFWIALWFATHSCHSIENNNKYVYFDRSNNPYAYIFIMNFGKAEPNLHKRFYDEMEKYKKLKSEVGTTRKKSISIPPPSRSSYGIYDTNTGYRVVDLRALVPSTYRRPHAQHGLLAKKIRCTNQDDIDYADAVVGTIRIKTDLALEWLGTGQFLQPHFIFPPQQYDHGYKLLLKKLTDPENTALGSIQIIGA